MPPNANAYPLAVIARKLEKETKMKNILSFILFVSILSCGKKREIDKKYAEDLQHVLNISNCDSLENDSIFIRYSKIKWPSTKPHSITEAMGLLDSAINDFGRHQLKICSNLDLYFGLGLAIRNNWVRHGEEDFKSQLFDKLSITHIDNTSGIIISYYRQYISQNKVDMAKIIEEQIPALSDSQKLILLEIKKIDKEINDLK